MNSYWVQILDFPFHCSNVLCSLAQCILNSITQSRITPARGFLTSEQSTVYCVGHYCWRSEPEDWEPPTCEKNVGEEGRKQDQKSRCFTMDIENTPTPRKKKKKKPLPLQNVYFCVYECVRCTCEKLLRLFYLHCMAAREKPWSSIQNGWVWFLVFLPSLDLSFDFSISPSFK